MPLHRLRSVTIGVPCVDAARSFYAELGLAETQAGVFETCDGGEQLRIEHAPQRRLLALSVGADDADDLGRIEAALGRLGVPAARSERRLDAADPATLVRVRIEIDPRRAQKPPEPLATNAPGRTLRADAGHRPARHRPHHREQHLGGGRYARELVLLRSRAAGQHPPDRHP